MYFWCGWADGLCHRTHWIICFELQACTSHGMANNKTECTKLLEYAVCCCSCCMYVCMYNPCNPVLNTHTKGSPFIAVWQLNEGCHLFRQHSVFVCGWSRWYAQLGRIVWTMRGFFFFFLFATGVPRLREDQTILHGIHTLEPNNYAIGFYRFLIHIIRMLSVFRGRAFTQCTLQDIAYVLIAFFIDTTIFFIFNRQLNASNWEEIFTQFTYKTFRSVYSIEMLFTGQ